MMAPLTNEILQQLAREFGTPLYVYHAEKISDQYQQLRKAFQQGVGTDQPASIAAYP